MKAKDLAEKLLEHPDFDVHCVIKGFLYGDTVAYFCEAGENDIEFDETDKIVYIGKD